MDLLSSDLTSLICFSTVHIVGSWPSKLPSIMYRNVSFCWFIFLALEVVGITNDCELEEEPILNSAKSIYILR